MEKWNEDISAGKFRIIALLKKLQLVSSLAAYGSFLQLKYVGILFDSVAVCSNLKSNAKYFMFKNQELFF